MSTGRAAPRPSGDGGRSPAAGAAPTPAGAALPGGPADGDPVAARLSAAGCVAPEEEAAELRAAAPDDEVLEALLARRERGEPLAWLTGEVRFAGHRVVVLPGVYVPRCQTEPLAARAGAALPPGGLAVDLCSGSGAVALALLRAVPSARVVASDIDPLACACAARNGVEVFQGDLAAPLPRELFGRCDVVTAVPPYVPTDRIAYLPRDVRTYEPRRALDGGADGLSVLARVLDAAAGLLRPGGRLFVELGGNQDEQLATAWRAAGFGLRERVLDEDGDLRALVLVAPPAGG